MFDPSGEGRHSAEEQLAIERDDARKALEEKGPGKMVVTRDAMFADDAQKAVEARFSTVLGEEKP